MATASTKCKIVVNCNFSYPDYFTYLDTKKFVVIMTKGVRIIEGLLYILRSVFVVSVSSLYACRVHYSEVRLYMQIRTTMSCV